MASKPAASTKKRSTASTSAASRNGSTRARTTKPKPKRKRQTASSSNSQDDGVTATLKEAASKAKGPAVAVGVAAAGLAGGLVLKGRSRRKTVLGIPLPRSLGGKLPDLDAKALAKSVGHASQEFAKRSKSVSKDLERAGDQAERIGKILG